MTLSVFRCDPKVSGRRLRCRGDTAVRGQLYRAHQTHWPFYIGQRPGPSRGGFEAGVALASMGDVAIIGANGVCAKGETDVGGVVVYYGQ